MLSVILVMVWMGVIAVRNFAGAFYRLGTKKDVVTSWKIDATGSLVAAIIAAALIVAWLIGW